MKILTGRYRGKKFSTKSSVDIRPTTERAKEWLFQIINDRVPGSRFLDLFSGTGNLGLEALSRGSEEVYFVDAKSTHLIKRNISNIINNQSFKIIKDNVDKFIKKQYILAAGFDIITADPPYDYENYSLLYTTAERTNILAPGGLFILEKDRHGKAFEIEQNLHPIKEKTFGDTVITIYQKVVS